MQGETPFNFDVVALLFFFVFHRFGSLFWFKDAGSVNNSKLPAS